MAIFFTFFISFDVREKFGEALESLFALGIAAANIVLAFAHVFDGKSDIFTVGRNLSGFDSSSIKGVAGCEIVSESSDDDVARVETVVA